MSKLRLRPLSLALVCLLAPIHHAMADTASVSIPLDIIQENYGNGQFGYRIGINVGVNGATPEEYIFDTGSTAFNIDVGSSSAGQPWFPLLPGVPVVPSIPAMTLYGNGTYGNLGANTTVASMQFYNSATNAVAANFNNSQGIPVLVNQGSVATAASLGGDQQGAQVGYFLPTYGYGFTNAEITTYHLNTTGAVPMYLDATWQQNLNQGIGPEDGGGAGLFGIFGAGEFGNDSVLGNLTTSGYVVAANSQLGSPQGCADCGHVILNLTPAVRAQFLSLVPWNNGTQGTFPLSGAPVSGSQFDLNFAYTLNGGQYSATLQTLLDSGTPTIYLNDAGLLAEETAAGHVNAYGDEIPGVTLTMTGAAPGALPTSILTGDDSTGDVSNVVTPGPNADTSPGQALYGISFFFNNSVMYDLQNQQTGYTPFYVSIDPVSTSGGYTVTSAVPPQGFAGIISGSGPFTVAANGAAQLSGTNTYTGATDVQSGGWLGLAGPGTIASTSNLQVDGYFDISRAWQTTTVPSLSGAGLVQLGDTTLELTQANGVFSGQIVDGGLGGGTGGRLIVAGGQEVLTGNNTFTGATGVSAPATLDVEGALASGVVNLGTLIDNGSILGNVVNGGLLAGQGAVGGNLLSSGIVVPGTGPANYQTLTVGGNFTQGGGAVYLAQINPAQSGASSRIAVGGSANLAAGAQLALAPVASGAFWQMGARYTLLSTGKGLTGSYTFDGPTMLSAVLGLATATDAQNVYLDVVQARAFTAAAQTGNQFATLAGVQSLAGVASVAVQAQASGLRPLAFSVRPLDSSVAPLPAGYVYSVLANLPTDAALRMAANQLSGEIHATAQGVLLENSRYLRDAVESRLRQAGEGADTDGLAVRDGRGKLAWWGQFVGSWGQGSSDGNAAASKYTTGGLLLGADHDAGNNMRIGAAAGYTQTAVNTAARASTLSSRNLDLSVYAGKQIGAWGLRGGAAYAWHTLDGTRQITIPGLAGHELSRYQAHTAQVFGEAAYRIDFSHGSLEPFARAAHVDLREGGFQEHGGAANLTNAQTSHPISYTTLGARAASDFVLRDGQQLSLHGMLGWRRAFGHVDTATLMNFTSGAPFVVQGLPIARNALAASAGMTVKLTKAASFDLSYQGQLAHHAVDSGFRGSFNWRF